LSFGKTYQQRLCPLLFPFENPAMAGGAVQLQGVASVFVQAVGVGPQDQPRQVCGVAAASFFSDALAVYMYGVVADAELPCHFFVALAQSQQARYVTFAW